jgi:hypothetical protein
VLLRLAARNHLGWSLARQLFASTKLPRAGLGFYRTGWIDERFLQARLGWTWQSPETTLVLPLIHLQEVLWAPTLRYCPMCMQGGFHSIWFQLVALQVCPFHGCRVTERCCVCGTQMGRYGLTRELFDEPFHCSHCQLPFAGAPVGLSDSLDVWHLRETVDASFEAYTRWMDLARERLICLDETAAQSGERGLGPHVIRMLQSAVHDMAPYPQGCDARESRSVRYITWRQIGADVRTVPFPTRYRYLSAGRALDVYRATLRALLWGVEAHPRASPALRLVFDGDLSSDLGGWSAPQLALILLRCAFELPCVLDLASGIDGIGIRESVFATALVGNRLRRLACQALILATYGAMIARAREYIARGYMSRTHLVASPREMIALAVVSDAGIHSGMAIIPTLDDLPPRLSARMNRSGFREIDLFNRDVVHVRAAREKG